MSITRQAGFFGKIATLWVAMVIAILCVGIGALLFFAAALVIWLDHYVGPAGAAALTGVVLLLEAVCIFIGFQLLLKNMRAKQPSLGGEMLGLAGTVLRVALLVIKRSPRKALVVAAAFGALTDYFTSSGHPKK